MEECDSLLLVGTSFPYLKWYPKPGQAKAVQIDMRPHADRAALSGRASAWSAMPGRRCKSCCRCCSPSKDRSFLEKAQEGMKEWRELMQTRENRDDSPSSPRSSPGMSTSCSSDNAIVTTDSGTITTWAARHIQIRRGMMFSCSGNLATMAPGLPYAIAAQAAYPDRQVVAFVGDGGFTMLMGDFVTAVKHKLPIKVVIIKNNTLGQIKWEQMVFLGNPEYGVDLHPIDFVKFAEACGGVGFRCERPDEVRPALQAAFARTSRRIVEAVVDPFEPPMPARAPRPSRHFTSPSRWSAASPTAARIIASIFKDKVKELV